MERPRFTVRALVKILAAGLLVVGVASPANAAPPPAPQPPMFLEKGDGYVIVNPAASKTIDSTTRFYPTGEVSKDTIVVIPEDDGTLPNGLSHAAVVSAGARSLQAAGTTAVTASFKQPSAVFKPAIYGLGYTYSATLNTWGNLVEGRGQIAGPNTDSLNYLFSPCCSGQFNQHQGIGWYRGYNGSTLGNYSKLYELGSVRGVSKTSHSVPWIPNTAAPAKLRGKCLQTAGCSGSWDSSF